jgi:hypothetical protein
MVQTRNMAHSENQQQVTPDQDQSSQSTSLEEIVTTLATTF